VIDIGLYSDGTVGLDIFFESVRWTPVSIVWKQMESESMPQAAQQKNGGVIFKNQANILTNPAAECHSSSNIVHIDFGGSKEDIGLDVGVILLPLLRSRPPMEGFSWDDLDKNLHGGQTMAKVHSGEEILPKASTP